MSMAATAMPLTVSGNDDTAEEDADSPAVTAAPGAVTASPAAALPPAAAPARAVPHRAGGSRRAARPVPVSATLAANEVIARKREAGEPVLPMAFGEAGLPAHPVLQEALLAASGGNAYGPVAGLPALREAAAGYWTRRGLPTEADAVVSGPGSKALLFALLLAIGADVAVPRPSWVSYAAQAAVVGIRPHFVPVPPGEGGVCDPGALARAVTAARAAGRRIGSVIVTLPDNPTARLARPDTVEALTEVAAQHDLIIISDEIYRELVYDGTPPLVGPAAFAPGLTVITTGLSKSLALGGWRAGVARLPGTPAGRALRDRVLGIGSEIWSATAGPVQQAAALAYREPPELTERISRSRVLHAAVAREVARRLRTAGVITPPPQAAFYLYPDFGPWRAYLAARHGVSTGAGLAGLLLERYGLGTLPASAFGEDASALRLRVATGLLYGDTDSQREQALAAPNPLLLPWIAAPLDRISEILADLAP